MAPLLPVLSLYLCTFIAVATAAPSHHPKCHKPNVRKEWRSLGASGQKAYADAIKCMSTLPHDPSLAPTGATPDLQPIEPKSSRYDDAVYTHMDALNSAHFTGRFLAWHRLFLNSVETILRTECGYKGTIPYWNWNLDHKDIKHAVVFDPNPFHGLGAFPSAASDFNLTTGAFKDVIRAYPVPHHIQRNYTLRPFEVQLFPFTFNKPEEQANVTQTKSNWDNTINSYHGDYTAFQASIDGVRAEGLHNAAHLSLGGDMASLSHSPNDPLFFLLHGQLDRLWAAWQARSPANARAIGGGETQDLTVYDQYPAGTAPWVHADTVIYMSNLGPDAPISDLFDTKGGFLCYEYDSFA